jgi:hypothetical protein
MAVAVGSQATTVPGGRRSRAVPLVVIGLAVAGGLVAIALEAWIRLSPPVSQGSTVAVLGAGGVGCDPVEFGGDASTICYEVPFVEGKGVGIGFVVRNTAPIPMTIVAVNALEAPFLTPAYLQPERIDQSGPYEYVFGLGQGRPFAPIEVGPNQDVPLQLVGTYLPCEQVARSYVPGSALIVDHARMTLRWAFVQTELDVPLGGALSLPAPDSCPGS